MYSLTLPAQNPLHSFNPNICPFYPQLPSSLCDVYPTAKFNPHTYATQASREIKQNGSERANMDLNTDCLVSEPFFRPCC